MVVVEFGSGNAYLGSVVSYDTDAGTYELSLSALLTVADQTNAMGQFPFKTWVMATRLRRYRPGDMAAKLAQ